MYDLIIVGGGPAGLTAALYAMKKQLHFVLISQDFGGKTNIRMRLADLDYYQMTRGADLVGNIKAELERRQFPGSIGEVTLIQPQEQGYRVKISGKKSLDGRSLIMATGVRAPRLNVPGERKFGLSGLSYSATSYLRLCTGKRVVVIGEGGRALRAAAELDVVADRLHLIGSFADEQESPLYASLKESSEVTMLDGQVLRFEGDKISERVVLGMPDGREQDILCDAIFVEQELIPNSDLVADIVDLDKKGGIYTDRRCRTSAPGVFAAGDVTTSTEQVFIAVGEGAQAALSAHEYLLPSL
jgi:alkyl hydroperoxide reductase subunit F